MLPRISHVYRLATEPTLQMVKRSRNAAKEDPVLRLRLAASDSRWNNHTHEWEDVGKLFIDAELWGDAAPAIAQVLAKGNEVYVSGALVLDEWTDKDGQKRSRVKIRAQKIQPIVRVEKPARRPTEQDDEPPF